MHEFLLSDPGWQEDPLHIIAKAVEEVESLPETAATFKFSDIIDHAYIGTAREELLAFTGAWEMPDIYASSGQRGERFVNPHYVHAHRYTDCYTECRCGFIQTHPQPKDTEVNPPLDNANRHGNCQPYHRMEMRAELMRQRERTIRSGLRQGIERLKLARRIGLKGNHISHVCQRLNIPIEEIRGEYIDARGETMAELAEQGYATTTIAKAYGISRGHASKEIKKYGRPLKQIREGEQ